MLTDFLGSSVIQAKSLTKKNISAARPSGASTFMRYTMYIINPTILVAQSRVSSTIFML